MGIRATDIEKAVYRKIATKRAITNIVKSGSRIYKFTSLAKFNVVLKQFNVVADRGKEDTMMFQKNNLFPSGWKIYKTWNSNKSQLYIWKANFANLGTPIEKNREQRKPYRDDLKKRIEQVFGQYNVITRNTFLAELQKQNIHAVFRQNEKVLFSA